MNIPAIDKDQLLTEMKSLNIHYMIMPDLNKEDGLMQVAVYQPDREKFGSWYERYLIGVTISSGTPPRVSEASSRNTFIQ